MAKIKATNRTTNIAKIKESIKNLGKKKTKLLI